MSQIHIIALLLSSSALATAAFSLLRYTLPKKENLKNCRRTRIFLVIAYFIIVVANIVMVTVGSVNSDLPYLLAVTLLVASFEASLFNSALITLIHRDQQGDRTQRLHIILIVLLSVLLVTTMIVFPAEVFMMVFYTCLAGYVVQLAYYVYRFQEKFNDYYNRLDNFFSDDEPQRMKWVRSSFFMALGVGIFSLLILFMPSYLHIVYVIAFTVFYIYFAAKTINYFGKYHHFTPADTLITLSVPTESTDVQRGMEAIAPALKRWVKSKGYIQQGITLKTLAAELGTNQTYLSAYINSSTGSSFRNWISMLRVEEAQRLLLEQENIPVSYIGEKVGISNKSSFFRQFVNITGKTPGSYRDEFFSSKAGW